MQHSRAVGRELYNDCVRNIQHYSVFKYLNTVVHTMHYVRIYFAFIKVTLNAISLVHQVTLFE
jgi:hypothetical protein